MIATKPSGLADKIDCVEFDCISSFSDSNYERDISFNVLHKKGSFYDAHLYVNLEDYSDYEISIDTGVFNEDEKTSFVNFSEAISCGITFKNEDDAKKAIRQFAKEGKDWTDHLNVIKDAETIQSLTYRVFDLIEPAIKAAIAQALQEHLES